MSELREKINPRAIRQSYLDRIEKPLQEQGAVLFDETRLNIEEDYLTLPPNITDLPSKELGEYLNAFTQQKMYLRTLLGRIDLYVEEARREYYEASEPVYARYSFEKLSETAKERLVNSDERVKPKYYNYIDYKKKYNILEISIANIEDAIFLLSREVTRRTADFNEENRAYNVEERRRCQ